MTVESYLPVILGAAVITYATRFAGLSLGERHPPPGIQRFLDCVPIAAFAAIIAPDLSAGSDETVPRIVGAAIAAMAVYRFGKLWVCIAAGMTGYWLVRWIL
jgi:branched-subunit amino acid transport protein